MIKSVGLQVQNTKFEQELKDEVCDLLEEYINDAIYEVESGIEEGLYDPEDNVDNLEGMRNDLAKVSLFRSVKTQ